MTMLPEGVELIQTCGACPEQYDMLLFGKRVGYLRLRHSHCTVEIITEDFTEIASLAQAIRETDSDE